MLQINQVTAQVVVETMNAKQKCCSWVSRREESAGNSTLAWVAGASACPIAWTRANLCENMSVGKCVCSNGTSSISFLRVMIRLRCGWNLHEAVQHRDDGECFLRSHTSEVCSISYMYFSEHE